MSMPSIDGLPVAVLDALPNPVLVKDAETRYVWVNAAFERLFDVRTDDLVGRLDTEVFQYRQAAQCNGGDLRVLESGEVDEASEAVVDPQLGERETITRKSRIEVGGQYYLIGVMHDITEVTEQNRKLAQIGSVLEQQATELQRLASTDPLTGALNRRAMHEQLDALTAGESELGVIAIDLDHFKTINDTAGHAAGDRVLTEVVERVRREIRPTDLVARLGGEEFLVIVPELDAASTVGIAERIRAAIDHQEIDVDGESLRITVSVGVCHDAHAERSTDMLLRDADERLYEAKRSGRNTVVAA